MEKIILVAYDLNPNIGSECVNAHNWLVLLAKHFSVEVFVEEMHRNGIQGFEYGNSVKFHYIKLNDISTRIYRLLGYYNFVYRKFIDKIRPVLIDIIKRERISLIHYITPASIHSFNELYKEVDVPYIVGPLGGGLRTPKGFNELFGIKDAVKNYFRDKFYLLQKKNKNLSEYLLGASKIIIGTEYLIEYLPEAAKNKAIIIFDTFVDLKYDGEKIVKKKDYVQIIFSGYLSAIKGVLILIEAIKIIKLKREDIASRMKVIILGDGPLRKKAERIINENKLNNTVIMKGRVSRKAVIEQLIESDIFCLPTLRDHGGLAILEAMALGLPVITSSYGGPKYSVTDQCGIKIEPTHYQQYLNDLVDALIKLISDERLRKQMGLMARERVAKDFSMQALNGRILNVYNEVLGRAN